MAAEKAATARTPARAAKPPPSSSNSKQKSIKSFFSKVPARTPTAASSPLSKVSPAIKKSSFLQETTANSLPKAKPLVQSTTPVPSSDAIEPPSSQENMPSTVKVDQSLPSPVSSPAETGSKQVKFNKTTLASSPTRKVCTQSNSIAAFTD